MGFSQTVYSGRTTQFPMAFKFTPKFDGAALLYVGGSAWTSNAGSMVGFQIAFDNNVIGTASVYTNEPSSHKAVVANMLPVTVPGDGQQHTITVTAINGTTVIDQNDVLQIVLVDINTLDQCFVWNPTGPVPAYTTFKSNITGMANLFFSGSGWVEGSAGTTGLVAVIDHTPITTSSMTYNAVNSHLALPPMIVPVKLTVGEHQIGFSTSDGNLYSDANDRFCLAVWW